MYALCVRIYFAAEVSLYADVHSCMCMVAVCACAHLHACVVLPAVVFLGMRWDGEGKEGGALVAFNIIHCLETNSEEALLDAYSNIWDIPKPGLADSFGCGAKMNY